MENDTVEHSVGSSEPPKRPTDDDVIRERTALRVQSVEPVPVADILTEEEFGRRFMGRHVVTIQAKEAIRKIEEMRRQVFCKKCEEHDEQRLIIKVTELCVRYEEDPLRAVPCLALCTCFRCGFEMYVDMKRKPDLRSEAEKLQEEAARIRERDLQRMKASGNFGYIPYGSSLGNALGQNQTVGGGMSSAIAQTQAAIDFARQTGMDGANISHLHRRLHELQMQDAALNAQPAPPPARAGSKYKFGEY